MDPAGNKAFWAINEDSRSARSPILAPSPIIECEIIAPSPTVAASPTMLPLPTRAESETFALVAISAVPFFL